MTESDDPAVIQSVVVTAADLVAALEASHGAVGEDTVLRVTPPFSGRMRARLHVDRGLDAGEPGPICLQAESLVEDSCPAPPEADDVEDALRADPDATYTIDRHRERYRVALQRWRESVPDHAVEEVALQPTGQIITISLLGTVSDE